MDNHQRAAALLDRIDDLDVVLDPTTLVAIAQARATLAMTEPLSPAGDVEVFLTNIDPGELQKAALNRDDLGSDENALTVAMLTQLKEWARGG